MNINFSRQAGISGMLVRCLRGGVGVVSRSFRAIKRSSGMLPELTLAMKKRELEKTLRAQGYSLRLAKIAASEDFPSTVN